MHPVANITQGKRHADPVDADVAIIGYGPVGQMLAGLLGRAGHRVAVFERFQDIYRLPRAVHLDGEIMRLLQSLGLAETLAEDMIPVPSYQWFGADGEPLLRFRTQGQACSGWERDYLFFQPDLETALDGFARAQPGVTVQRGWEAVAFTDSDSGVEISVRRMKEAERGRVKPTDETRTVRARWLIGADGANSVVREASAITRRDLEFQERWLVVDVEPNDMGALAYLPVAGQWCEPGRPRTHVQSGRGRRRWEFMLLPDEQPSDFADPARVWSLLAPWFTPRDGALTRSAVYDQMRKRHALLAGDAAHLTPPFLGQGMCSGLRDAANVAWKLDLVLRGLASERLLDTIHPERQPHNEAVIRIAGELGKVLCELDPRKAAERDEKLRATERPPEFSLPPLTAGALHRGARDGSDPLAGALSVQGVVACEGRQGRFNDVAGQGFTLIVAAGDPFETLSGDDLRLLDTLRFTVASLDPGAPHGVRDLDGRLTDWLAEHGAYAVLVRPDFYVFGSSPSPEELPALLDDLRAQLHIKSTITTPGVLQMSDTHKVIHPKFHHANLKTRRLQEMIDWYSELVGTEVNYQYEHGAWISNDQANHRIALLAFPNFVDDPEKETRTGLHHTAFEYDTFEDLNASYLRLKDVGIVPDFCLDHGMTLSYYYRDPDGNRVELQIDAFGDWAKSAAWMRENEQFHADPIGPFVDPDRVAAAAAEGATFDEIHARAMAGELAPEQAPVDASKLVA
jgi:2-polyprenyl-6-methoxyphenol hydroxylase-like FAD-dependent oxidoreductase/catechol 2,3-dioxygenase-like lactoylglutathione lyase family enzyme